MYLKVAKLSYIILGDFFNCQISCSIGMLFFSRLFSFICMLFHPQSQLLLCDKFPSSHLQGWKIRTVQ